MADAASLTSPRWNLRPAIERASPVPPQGGLRESDGLIGQLPLAALQTVVSQWNEFANNDSTSGVLTAKDLRGFDVPWMKKQLAAISRIRSLGESWHSQCEIPPNDLAIRLAFDVLEKAADLDFEPTNVDPSVDEGVCISFRRRDRYADIECFNTGELLAAESIDDGETNVWEVRDVSDALARIREFVRQT